MKSLKKYLLTTTLFSFSGIAVSQEPPKQPPPGALGARPVPEEHPIYAQLKPYRTYLTVGEVSPEQEHFVIYAREIEPMVEEYGADSVEEVKNKSLKELLQAGAWGGLALPPKDFPEVPADKKELAEALVKKFQTERPAATDVKVIYVGRFGTVFVNENVPTGLATQGRPRIGQIAFARLKWTHDSAEFGDSVGMASPSGYGLLSRLGQAEPALPDFVDFKMSPDLEGQQVLGTWLLCRNHCDGKLKKEWKRFSKALRKAMNEKLAGTYQNPIEKILAEQGPTLLPANFSQRATLSLRLYARHEDFAQQKTDNLVLDFSVDEASKNGVKVEKEFEAYKLKLSALVDLKAATVRLVVTDLITSQEIEKSYSLKQQGFDLLLKDGDRVALRGPVSLLGDGLGKGADFVLPGKLRGGFTNVDLYSDSVKPLSHFVSKKCADRLKQSLGL